jgi:hypothetical protein
MRTLSQKEEDLSQHLYRDWFIATPELEIMGTLRNFGMDREDLTQILLSLSLCPLHMIDYAICFDDRTAECNSIRHIHPNHDT